ncbi:pilin [Nonomuraea insulae]|uniref:Pilin n=1 Tax=Nonomuraea insulae TaxID=1616787 RepID=A0ABW1CPI1_9ACTN
MTSRPRRTRSSSQAHSLKVLLIALTILGCIVLGTLLEYALAIAATTNADAAGLLPASGRVLAAPASLNAVIDNLRNVIVGLLVALATLFLTVGGVRYILAGGDPGEVEAAKKRPCATPPSATASPFWPRCWSASSKASSVPHDSPPATSPAQDEHAPGHHMPWHRADLHDHRHHADRHGCPGRRGAEPSRRPRADLEPAAHTAHCTRTHADPNGADGADADAAGPAEPEPEHRAHSSRLETETGTWT